MTTEISCWELIELDKFEEACQKADEDYKKSNSLSDLGNKVIALMKLKRYTEVAQLCLKLIELNKGMSDNSDFIYAGISYWLLCKPFEAIELWKNGLNAQYTDAAGGISIPSLLYYASVVMGDSQLQKDAINILKKKWKTKQAQANFPGTIAGYLLEQISENELINSLSNEPYLMERETCKAKFYIALKCLQNGDRGLFYRNLKECVISEPAVYLEYEHYLAIGELDKDIK